MVRREGSSIQSRVSQWVARRLVWAARGTICTRRPMRRARLILSGLALILAAGSWRPASTLAQLPTGTPTYNVNAKWVTDRGSQVFNVKAYGAKGDGTTDDTTAINAAFTAAGVGGHILFPPGNYVVSSELNWATSYQTIEGYGAYILCNQSSASICAQIGNASNANAAGGITIQGLGFTPGSNTATSAIIADNAQNTKFVDVTEGSQSLSACSSQAGGYCHYGYFIENEDDQAEVIDHLYGVGGATCTAAFCGAAVYQPYGSSYAGITWIQNSNLSMGCNGNSIDWQSGQNSLTVKSSILQSFSQFALRAFNSVDIDGHTHWEQGNCTNPLNDGNGHALGGAGLILHGTGATVEGGAAGGVVGTVFSTNASGGSSTYWYYVVGHGTGGVTAPLLAGYLVNGPATISGSAVVYAVWPALTASSVTTFDLLRTSGTVPYGTGNFAVATGLAVGTYCTASGGLVCAFTDTVGAPSSYTIAGESLYPIDTFWPGNLVVFSNTTSNTFGVGSYSGPLVSSLIVNAAPNDTTVVHVTFTGAGNLYPGSTPYGPGFIAEGNQYSANASISTTAQLIPGGVSYVPSKGAINFGTGPELFGSSSSDLITIYDSNFSKTLADVRKRPLWDAADTALCGDPPSGSGACLRGPTVSQYIGILPDGSNWATRTASTGISDAVPHYGLKSISSGAPNTPTLTDVSSATTCQNSHTYYFPNTICFDGTNFEEPSLVSSPYGTITGATAPTWATTPGQSTLWNNINWICLGTGSLAANTTYYFKTAGCTLGGCSLPTSEVSITTANDGATHIVLPHGTAKPGHTSYQVGCSTTTGTEALLTAPYTGAYTGNAYQFPAMNCSGAGGFNSSDQTGYALAQLPIGDFNGGTGASSTTFWRGDGTWVSAYATVASSGSSVTQRNTLNFIGGGSTIVSCADNSGASRTDCTFTSSGSSTTYGGWLGGSGGTQTVSQSRVFPIFGYQTNANPWPMPFSANISGWNLCLGNASSLPATIGTAEYLTSTTPTLNLSSLNTVANSAATTCYSASGVPSVYVPQGTPIIAETTTATGGGPQVTGYTAQITGVNAQPLGGALNGATIAVGTVYTGVSTSATPNATETNIEIPIALTNGGTIQNLCFINTAAMGASASLTATLRHGVGSSGAMANTSLVATAGNSQGAFSNNCDLASGHAFTVANGDRISIAWTATGATSAAIGGYSFELIPASPATGMIVAGMDAISWLPGTNRYTTFFTTTGTYMYPEFNAQAMTPRAATAGNMQCYVVSAPSGGSHTFTLRQNGASPTSGPVVTVATSFSAPGVQAGTGSVGLNQNDLIDVMETAPSTPAVMSACSEEID